MWNGQIEEQLTEWANLQLTRQCRFLEKYILQ